jgi:hypothetical protein
MGTTRHRIGIKRTGEVRWLDNGGGLVVHLHFHLHLVSRLDTGRLWVGLAQAE